VTPYAEGVMVPESRLRGRWAPWAVLAGVAGAAAYVAAIDPNRPGHYPTCPFLALTGYYCPGCGSLRMVHALAHGHVAQGAGLNPLAFAVLPLLAWLWFRWAGGRSIPVRILRPPLVIAFAVVVVGYWVVRNLPFARALAP
jgi:Protein of unknown function (DUF2752)